MKKETWAMAILMTATGTTAAARQPGPEARPDVTVCMTVPPGPAVYAARAQASEMFARIGVKLGWHTLYGCPSGALSITLAEGVPSDRYPGALGYATPFEGTHIVVFWDRIQRTLTPEHAPSLLAHVMVHEITHILEGTDCHSEFGVMKAHWTETEYVAMRKGLPFDPIDLGLIRAGLAKRAKLNGASAAAE